MNTIHLTDSNGHTGTAEIKWIDEDEWAVAHYSACITVPFQSNKQFNLFVFDKRKIDEAVGRAKSILEISLAKSCT